MTGAGVSVGASVDVGICVRVGSWVGVGVLVGMVADGVICGSVGDGKSVAAISGMRVSVALGSSSTKGWSATTAQMTNPRHVPIKKNTAHVNPPD